MTSAKWSDAPFAVWIRKGLADRNEGKAWLIRQLAAHRKIPLETAEANVHRWTAQTTIPTGENLAFLVGLFGEPPSVADAQAYRDHEARLIVLERDQETLMRLAVSAGTGRRKWIAVLQEALDRRTGGS